MRNFGKILAVAGLFVTTTASSAESESLNLDRAKGYLEAQLGDRRNGRVILQDPNGSSVICGWIFDWAADIKMHEYRLFAYIEGESEPPTLLIFAYDRSTSQVFRNIMVVHTCDRANYLAAPMPVGRYAEASLSPE